MGGDIKQIKRTCVYTTDTHTLIHTSRTPSGKDWGHHTPKANVLEGIIIVLTCKEKKDRLKLNRPYRGRDIFISLSRLTFPLKQADWLVCLCYYGGGQEDSTLFFHGRSVLVTPRISLSLSLSSALALTPKCCVTSIGADDVFYDTFLPMWVLRLVLRSHILQSVPATILVYLLLVSF